MRFFYSAFIKISFPYTSLIPFLSKTKDEIIVRAKGEIRTKDEPKNPKIQKVLFVKVAVSFTSLIPCLIPPTDDRENTERRAKFYRALAAKNSALFLRLAP